MPIASSSLRRPEVGTQVERLVDLGYPEAAGVDQQTFRSWFAGLVEPVLAQDGPTLVVVPRSLVTAPEALGRVVVGGRSGVVDMTGAAPLSEHGPVDGIRPPQRPYLLHDLQLGEGEPHLPPERAVERIRAAGRSPLTIDEGIAVVTQLPEVLTGFTGLWLMGERSGDRRVPALWVSKGRTRLGWCWQGALHDWLAPATCRARVASS